MKLYKLLNPYRNMRKSTPATLKENKSMVLYWTDAGEVQSRADPWPEESKLSHLAGFQKLANLIATQLGA